MGVERLRQGRTDELACTEPAEPSPPPPYLYQPRLAPRPWDLTSSLAATMSTPDDALKPKISFSFGAKKVGASPAGAATVSSSSTTKPFALPKPKTAAPVKPPTAFALAADDDEPAPAPVAESSKSGRSWGKPKADPKTLVHQAVKPSRAIRERQEEALGLDQRAFAYDEVWDSMKDAEKAAKQRREDESSDRKVRPLLLHRAAVDGCACSRSRAAAGKGSPGRRCSSLQPADRAGIKG